MQGEILQVNLPWWFPKDGNLVPLPLAIGVVWRRCVCVCVCVSTNGERRKIERWAGSLHVYSKACFPRKLLIIYFSRTIHSHAPSSHQKTSTKPLSHTHTPAGHSESHHNSYSFRARRRLKCGFSKTSTHFLLYLHS